MMAYLLTWLLILLAGTATAAALYQWPRRGGELLLTLGSATIFGLLLAGIGVAVVAGTDTASLAWRSWPLLIAMAGVGAYFGWRGRIDVVADAALRPSLRPTEWLLLAIVLLLIGIRLIPLLNEVLLRPVYPWDAWSVWMVKPKAWFLSGHYDRFVDPVSWFAAAGGVRTLPAYDYPELSGRIQLLFAVALGEWNEPLLLLPWFVVYIALLLSLAGLCLRLGCQPWSTGLACYALSSLPLINAQVALAGYLDLWIGAVLMLSLGTWLLWRRERRTRLLITALALAVSMVMIKREGLVWLALLLALVAFDRLSPAWQRKALVTALIGVIGLVIAAVGFGGWIDEQTRHLTIPGIGKLDLAWRPGGLIIIKSIFTHSNWHLLGLFLIAIPLLRWRQLRADRDAQLLGLFILAAWVALLMLFCLTPAAEWAVRQTATNRLILQLVPTMMLWLVLLLRDLRWPIAQDVRLPANA